MGWRSLIGLRWAWCRCVLKSGSSLSSSILTRTPRRLAEFLGDIPVQAKDFQFEGLALTERRDYIVNCNWKVYVDNYLDAYHIPIVHPGLMKEIDYPRYRTETYRYYSQQIGPVKTLRPGDNAERVYPPGIGLKEALYFWVFPNLMLNFYPDNIQTNIIVPLSHDKTLTIFEWYFHDAHSETSARTCKEGHRFQ